MSAVGPSHDRRTAVVRRTPANRLPRRSHGFAAQLCLPSAATFGAHLTGVCPRVSCEEEAHLVCVDRIVHDAPEDTADVHRGSDRPVHSSDDG